VASPLRATQYRNHGNQYTYQYVKLDTSGSDGAYDVRDVGLKPFRVVMYSGSPVQGVLTGARDRKTKFSHFFCT
jgi:hypothetical protein